VNTNLKRLVTSYVRDTDAPIYSYGNMTSRYWRSFGRSHTFTHTTPAAVGPTVPQQSEPPVSDTEKTKDAIINLIEPLKALLYECGHDGAYLTGDPSPSLHYESLSPHPACGCYVLCTLIYC
jgi:hypothetical protein